ncbi:MAG: hypothetical protein HY566_01765 [Candidatus Kerfeldbacteria bacterium]|nr:hypothetical protein [Candidatus Kerfeldbacteria bacterium]
MRTALFLTAVIWALAPRSARAIEFSNRLEGLIENTALYRFASTPISVRDIPPHRDDGFLTNRSWAPIEDAPRNFRAWTASARYLAGVRWDWFEFQAGLMLTGAWRQYPTPPMTDRSRLYNTYRNGDSFDGHCDCARYYELRAKSTTMLGTRLVVSARTPYLPFPTSTGFRLRASLELDPLGRPLEFETGWDRYNRDEVRAFIAAGRLREYVAAVRLEFGGSEPGTPNFFADAGYVASTFSPRSNFNGLKLTNRDHFRFALGVVLTN